MTASSFESDLAPLPQVTSKVARFYGGRKVFVTGATGFLGKVLIHKLLMACPDISTIYILVRPKRGKQPQERLQELLSVPIFTKMPKNLLCKVVAIEGDITAPKLGLSTEDEDKLISNVSVIFHSAAAVKFDEDLSKSLMMNVMGTQSVINLAKKVGNNLTSFVHVSTAYSHSYRSTIDEEFYENELSPEDMLEISKRIKHSLLDSDEMTKMLIGQHPNTYTFTKALGEQLVKDQASELPVSIFRPSIVVASAQEPMPGWVDNLNGATGLITAYGAGIYRTAVVDVDKRGDIVPVDLAANMLCLIAWKTSTDAPIRQRSGKPDVQIYNFTSGQNKPFTWRELQDLGNKHYSKYPFEYILWLPGGSFKKSRVLNQICEVLLHYLPALFVDLGLKVAGQKPFLMKIVNKMSMNMKALVFFANREWTWSNQNVHNLNDELDEDDRKLFCADLRSDLPDWEKFWIDYLKGIRHFVLKNDPNSIEWCRTKYKIYQVMDFLAKAILVFMCFKLLTFFYSL